MSDNSSTESSNSGSVPQLPQVPWVSFSVSPVAKKPAENYIGNIRVAGLQKHLFAAAADSARFALTRYADSMGLTRVQCAVAAGSAIEYLARCVVLAGDPVLLAQPTHVESRLALSRVVNTSAFSPKALRTITATDVIKLVAKMHPTVFKSANLAEDVFGLRNSAAHMAIALEEDLTADMVKLTLVASELLAVLSEDEDAFWGVNLDDVARYMKKTATDAIANRVASKLAAARERYAELTYQFDDSNQEAMLRLWERRLPTFAIDEDGVDQKHSCPACTRSGYLSFYKEVDTSDFQTLGHSDDPSELELYASAKGIPTMFQCPVCSLRLDNSELDLFPDLCQTIDLPDELVVDLSEIF